MKALRLAMDKPNLFFDIILLSFTLGMFFDRWLRIYIQKESKINTMDYVGWLVPILGGGLVIVSFIYSSNENYKNKEEKKKFENQRKARRRWELWLGVAIMVVSIYSETTKTNQLNELKKGNDSLNTKSDNLIKQISRDSAKINSSVYITNNKIDTAKNNIVDSIKSVNESTIKILQKLNLEQAKGLDSLSKIHGEKELTYAEKKYILHKIDSVKLANKGMEFKTANVNIISGSNGQKVASDIVNLLKGLGYNTIGIGTIYENIYYGIAVWGGANNIYITVGTL